MSKDWNRYLANPNIKVMMDNDQWWFQYKEGCAPEGFDPEFYSIKTPGGEGPYGLDLLIHMLNHIGIEVELV